MTRQRQWARLAGWSGLALFWLCCQLPAMGQTLDIVVRQEFLSDPLLDEPRDPLLPVHPIQRPLSPLEKYQLELDLDQLHQQALALSQTGQPEPAYDAWMREVRLRRLLGLDQELAAIQRVGQRVRQAGRTQDVQLLTVRLQQIRDNLAEQSPLDQRRLQETAVGFEVLGNPDEAIATYELLKQQAQAQDNQVAYRYWLQAQGRLQQAWFKFAAAAETYQELLERLPPEELLSEDDAVLKQRYLQALIDSQQQQRRYQETITAQQQLLQHYRQVELLSPIPALEAAIARNYRAIDQLNQAATFYRRAYEDAIVQQQFAQASDIVRELAEIYQSLERVDDTVYLYELLLQLERQSYNAYGIAAVFDQLGQLYAAQGQTDLAMAAFREGLIVAQHMDYRQGYFRNQIRRLRGDLPTAADEADEATPAEPTGDVETGDTQGDEPMATAESDDADGTAAATESEAAASQEGWLDGGTTGDPGS
ncbi:uncharacterized protein XM38_041580 [Halomicronema hongdechloris C2206]|uniref:Uncharacterized protein n=1 Tax=Halomicronema hongdechloris C2206 TaxID=1641165 RepID=A0A1Z3HSF3_9CYAN|nr:hypothetical protein [Halomicronema hongdechloris]ASC73196.1 uncharacterized protein XM38_041580 [Halomicronema hongdechloris C2206]